MVHLASKFMVKYFPVNFLFWNLLCSSSSRSSSRINPLCQHTIVRNWILEVGASVEHTSFALKLFNIKVYSAFLVEDFNIKQTLDEISKLKAGIFKNK